MKCPFCGFEESKVVDSRSTDDGDRIRRRRECLQCAKRFTTYEIIEHVPIVVVKKDGSREAFDREKLLTGLLRACEKRQVPVKVLEVNRDHPLLRNMLRMFKADGQDRILAEMTRSLFDASLLLDGYLKDPQALAARTNELLAEAAAWYTEVRKI